MPALYGPIIMPRQIYNLLFLCVITSLLATGCHSKFSPSYSLDQLELVSEGVVENGIKLTYRVPGETLYHSPGAVVTNKNGKIDVTFPRAHIDTAQPKIDVVASANDDGTFSFTIPISPTEDQPVEILLNGTKKLGPWTIGPAD